MTNKQKPMKKSSSDTFLLSRPNSIQPYFIHVMQNNLIALKRLSLEGKPLHQENVWGQTLLHVAVTHGHLSIVKFLIQIGLDPSHRDVFEDTPLSLAIKYNHSEIIQYLSHTSSTQRTPIRFPIHNAAKNGEFDLLKHYLQQGEDDGNTVDQNGNTLLHYAVQNNHFDMVQYLVTDKKVNVNTKNIWNLTPLEEATYLGYDVIADLLRSNHAFFTFKSDSEQIIIGDRKLFFEKLHVMQRMLAFQFPTSQLIQFFHTTYHGEELYCCSKFLTSTVVGKELYSLTSRWILDHLFDTHHIQIVNHGGQQKQPQFLFSPYCRQYAIHGFASIPFHYRSRFMGYFFLWSGTAYSDEMTFDKNLFEALIDHHINICLKALPLLFFQQTDIPIVLGQIESKFQDAYKRDSYHFFNAVIWIMDVLHGVETHWSELSTTDVFQRMVACIIHHYHLHLPRSPAMYLYQKTSILLQTLIHKKMVSLPLPMFEPHKSSFVFQQLVQLFDILHHQTVERDVCLPTTTFCFFTSFDMYEIIGNHPYPKSLLPRINHLCSIPTEISITPSFVSLIKTFLRDSDTNYEIRTSNVIGINEGNQYCLFLPPSEIEKATTFLFEKIPQLHPIAGIYLFYVGFVEYIHPFLDGNGRFFRLCTNVFLRKYGSRRLLTKKLVTFSEFVQDHFSPRYVSVQSI